MHITRIVLAAMVAGSTLTLNAIPAAKADISRGCAARWEAHWSRTSVNGKLQNPKIVTFGRFDSRGRCRNRLKANECRDEARRYAQRCFNAHRAERWNARVPDACQLQRGNRGAQSYKLKNLKKELEQRVCTGLRPTAKIRVHLIGKTWGDKRCGSTTELSRTYEISPEMCEAVVGKQ